MSTDHRIQVLKETVKVVHDVRVRTVNHQHPLLQVVRHQHLLPNQHADVRKSLLEVLGVSLQVLNFTQIYKRQRPQLQISPKLIGCSAVKNVLRLVGEPVRVQSFEPFTVLLYFLIFGLTTNHQQNGLLNRFRKCPIYFREQIARCLPPSTNWANGCSGSRVRVEAYPGNFFLRRCTGWSSRRVFSEEHQGLQTQCKCPWLQNKLSVKLG